MPKPTQFRAIKYHIAGRNIEVAGLARPGLRGKQTEDAVVTYLQTHQFHTLISLEDPTKNLIANNIISAKQDMQYNQTYAVADFQPPSIDAMEGIYTIVRDNALNGKKTAIHCAAGLGRTGSILAALKLKELMLAMPSDELNNALNYKNQLIQLGEHAEGYRKDYKWQCTSLVKQAVEAIRSQGGSYHVDYVENEEQLDRLCEYQAYLINKILAERNALQEACQNSAIATIQQKISDGATPTQDMFVKAYTDGKIDVMNALIQGGMLPTAETCHNLPQSSYKQAPLFLELAISASALETQVEKFAQLALNEQNTLMVGELNTLLVKVRQFRSEWTSAGMPSGQSLNTIMNAVDAAMTSVLAEHRGLVRTTPVLRELVMGAQVVINAIRFVCIKIYKCLTLDKNPVHQDGVKAILQQPDTTTVLKIKEFKKTLSKLTHPGDSSSQQEKINSSEDHSNGK